MTERWSRERVLALAPDASSQGAALHLASPVAWPAAGWLAGPGPGPGAAVWGECKGSAASPYRTVVDLSGPAYRCSCPSRKFPCKHALGLLLLWSAGEAAPAPAAPGWAAEWLRTRAGRAAPPDAGRRAARGDEGGSGQGETSAVQDLAAARRRLEQREARVAAGLGELDRWLCDQVRHGLAGEQQAGYRHWDSMAARLVDAQAAGVAAAVRGLAAVPHSGAGWAGRLLEEYALLRLLVTAYRRQGELPGPVRETVRSRIGFTMRAADVPAAGGERLADRWDVTAQRDLDQDTLRARRVWLQGRRSGRAALVLSFAVAGQALDASFTVGTRVEAELAFYPAAVPLRAVAVAKRPAAGAGAPSGQTVAALLTSWASAVASDPWLETWPAVLAGVTPARAPEWCLADAAGDALPLHPGAGDCWPLAAVSAGHPVTVAGEWTPRGLWPLTAWNSRGEAVQL